MGLIKKPLDVDLYVDPRPITNEDLQAFSNYIKTDKLKRSRYTKRNPVAIKPVLEKG